MSTNRLYHTCFTEICEPRPDEHARRLKTFGGLLEDLC